MATLHHIPSWIPPEELNPSAWAEKHRYLTKAQSPRYGRWRNANAPYLTALMDACNVRGVQQINIVKGAQGGGSEAFRNVLGWIAHQNPEPCGLALPSKDKGRKIVTNRILPMFRNTAVLAELMTPKSADLQAEQVRLANGFILHLMWSGSATSMASDPMRLAVCDEVDKFEAWAGREADPVSLVSKRLRAYGNRGLLINISTPTTRFGKIWELFSASAVKLWFFVPCPDCGHMQRLVFPNLKWRRRDDLEDHVFAAILRASHDTWYECEACFFHITEDHRQAMTERGEWRQLDNAPINDAYGHPHASLEALIRSGAPMPDGTSIGFQLPALCYLWQPWSGIAAEFVLARKSMSRMYDFKTETLGEPFEDRLNRTPETIFSAKCQRAGLEEGICPDWSHVLILTVDTQKDYFFAVLRAWGPGMKSQRVWHGQVESFADLDRIMTTPWKAIGRPPMLPGFMFIDSGGTADAGDLTSRTTDVYRYAQARRARVLPIKGAARPRDGVHMWPSKGLIIHDRRNPRAAREEIRVWIIDTQHYADELAESISAGVNPDPSAPQPERWLLNKRDDPTYNAHLSNSIKVVGRLNGKMVEHWAPITEGARVDYWDCEVYQIAAAYRASVHLLPSEAELAALRASIVDTTPAPAVGVQTRPSAWTPRSFMR